MAPVAGRCASRAAARDMARATASVSMWAASDSSARDDASTPATTSRSMKPTISTSAAFSAPRSVSRESPGEWLCRAPDDPWDWSWAMALLVHRRIRRHPRHQRVAAALARQHRLPQVAGVLAEGILGPGRLSDPVAALEL